MNKPTEFWKLLVAIIGLIAMGLAAWINVKTDMQDLKTSRDLDRVRNDERYIETRQDSREIKSLLQDVNQKLSDQRILIEQKQNRQ